MLVSDSWDRTTRFCNAVSSEQQLVLTAHKPEFSLDGNRVALTRNGKLQVYDFAAGTGCRWLTGVGHYQVAFDLRVDP